MKWYDYPAAIFTANVIATSFFTIPGLGAIIAYVVYEYGWGSYCKWRSRGDTWND